MQIFNTYTFLPCYQTWFNHNSGPEIIPEDNRLHFSVSAVLISYWTNSEWKEAWDCKVKIWSLTKPSFKQIGEYSSLPLKRVMFVPREYLLNTI